MLIPPNLVNDHFNDRYFDVVNAIDEAKQIFFKGCNLLDILSDPVQKKNIFIIGETGFGAGRVLISLFDFLESNEITDISIDYNSVELFPITSDRMLSILDGFRSSVGTFIDLLVDAYSKIDLSKKGWHKIKFVRPFGILNLNLWIGEALEMVHSLETPCNAWFLDGHGPKKNPLIWRPELLLAVGEKTKINGTIATYTVAGHVRRNLADAGFMVERCPGCGGKKSVLKGIKISK